MTPKRPLTPRDLTRLLMDLGDSLAAVVRHAFPGTVVTYSAGELPEAGEQLTVGRTDRGLLVTVPGHSLDVQFAPEVPFGIGEGPRRLRMEVDGDS